MTPKQLKVVYFVSYIVTDPKDTDLGYKQILSEREYRENMAIYGAGSFTAQTGAEAVLRLLQDVDLEQEYADVQEALEKAQGEKRKKLIKRLDTINALENQITTEWDDPHKHSRASIRFKPNVTVGWWTFCDK